MEGRRKCEECGEKLKEEVNGEWICKNCGLISEENILITELNNQSFVPRKKEIKEPSRYVYTKKTFFGEKKKSKEEKEKLAIERKNSKIPKRWKEYLIEVKKLENEIKDMLPENIANDMFQQLVSWLNLNYKNRTKVDKNLIIWSFFHSLISNELLKLENSKEPKDEEYKIMYSRAINKLESMDIKRFSKVGKLQTRGLKKLAVKLNEINTKDFNFIIDFDVIDPMWKKIYNKDFYLMFSNEYSLLPEAMIRELENKVREAGIFMAKLYLKNKGAKQRLEEDSKNQLGKEEGLLCCCCYLVCLKNDFHPQKQEFWYNFFSISGSQFDKIYKKIQEMRVIIPPYDKTLSPRIEGDELFFK